MDVTAVLASDMGSWRHLNEDSGHVGRALWVVADGMGGHAAGDVASRLAVEAAARLDERGSVTEADIHALIAGASQTISAYGAEHAEANGLGTTIVGIAAVDVNGPCWSVFHVGDSRAYRWIGSRLERMTVDHTEVELLVLAGVITADQARQHPARNVVTQSLGSQPPPQADVRILRPCPGEWFLLCTDGLTGELTDGEIAEILRQSSDAGTAARTLVDAAVAAGGHDNVTALVIDTGPADDDDEEQTIIRPRSWTTR
jgi:protein phosphatase